MESFTAFLEKRVTQVDSLLCIGLDPHRGDLTEFSAQAAGAFCTRLIEATADIAAAYKPNAAFFEALGPEGIVALQSVIAAVPDGIPVLLDAKRGDIASTAEAYADAVYRVLGADAVTLSPYLGRDSIEPFIADPKQGVFLLCKTSNPGASDLQDLEVIDSSGTAPQRLYEHIATLAQTWNAHHNLGLVVGATQVESLDNVRAAAPDLWFLTPGIGAQGGDLRAALRAGLRADGLGMLIPVSRAIARADDPRETALALRSQINMEREEIMASKESPGSASALTGDQSQLADALLDAGCIQFGNFTLRSGLESPIYIDLRRLASYPKLLSQAAGAYTRILHELSFDHLAALPYAAMPIGTAVSLRGNWPMLYPRKEVKTYGTKAAIEGAFQPGQRAVIIEDLITSGGSIIEGIEKLTTAGLDVQDIVVLIDRRSPGVDTLAERGYNLHAVLTLPEVLDHYERAGLVSAAQLAAVRDFLTK